MSEARVVAALAALFLLATGCITADYDDGNKLRLERIEDIEPGEPSKKDIAEWFGPPQNYASPKMLGRLFAEKDIDQDTLAQYQFSDLLTYQFSRGKMKALALGLFNSAHFVVKSDYLVVFFDDEDIVSYYGFHKGTDELD